jgi:hypothetical protein
MFKVDINNSEEKDKREVMNSLSDLNTWGFVDVPKEIKTEEEFIQWMLT